MGSEVGHIILAPYGVVNHLFIGKFYTSKPFNLEVSLKTPLVKEDAYLHWEIFT